MDASSGPMNNAPFVGEGLSSGSCEDMQRCVYIFSRGYNRECSSIGSIRTVQRELTLEF